MVKLRPPDGDQPFVLFPGQHVHGKLNLSLFCFSLVSAGIMHCPVSWSYGGEDVSVELICGELGTVGKRDSMP